VGVVPIPVLVVSLHEIVVASSEIDWVRSSLLLVLQWFVVEVPVGCIMGITR